MSRNYFYIFLLILWNLIVSVLSKAVIRVSDDEWMLKNREAPKNWQNDRRYLFKWKGDFSYGIPELFPCEKVKLPKYGRFICSNSKKENLLSDDRVMCLPECMKDYENTQRPSVYLCTRDGQWLNLLRQPIETPKFDCMPERPRRKFPL